VETAYFRKLFYLSLSKRRVLIDIGGYQIDEDVVLKGVRLLEIELFKIGQF
jgi:hypothetical protein